MSDGRIALVTGATSGIGHQIALDLAQRDLDVILAGRNEAKLAAARADIAAAGGGGSLETVCFDLSSQASIRAFATRFCREQERLDVLVNCAGSYAKHREESVDGTELLFATNVLGYHLLATELLPLLKRSAPARIVQVASEFAGKLDLDDIPYKKHRYKGTVAYQRSKQANRMLTRALARRLEGAGVTVNSMAPGFVATPLYKNAPWWQRPILKMVGARFGHTVSEGADTAVWLAESPDIDGKTGGFYVERVLTPCKFDDVAEEEKLWAICERLTGAPT